MKDINILSSNGVNVEASLELLGDMEMYEETLNDFLSEMEDRIPKLEEFKNNQDYPNYAILAHSIKSDSKYLGFVALAELSLQQELEAKADNGTFIMEHYQEWMTEIGRILSLAEQYLG